MGATIVAAIVMINLVQWFYLVSELITNIRTAQGKNNSADRGTVSVVWILVSIAFVAGWFPVIFDFGRWLILGHWLTWAGVTIMILGIVFRRYSISTLGKFFTATIQIQKDHQLVKSGPYRYIRHPSYLGILIITLGLGLALANWISLLICSVIPAIGILRRISVEEKALARYFGQEYEDYRKGTWRIIPHIY